MSEKERGDISEIIAQYTKNPSLEKETIFDNEGFIAKAGAVPHEEYSLNSRVLNEHCKIWSFANGQKVKFNDDNSMKVTTIYNGKGDVWCYYDDGKIKSVTQSVSSSETYTVAYRKNGLIEKRESSRVVRDGFFTDTYKKVAYYDEAGKFIKGENIKEVDHPRFGPPLSNETELKEEDFKMSEDEYIYQKRMIFRLGLEKEQASSLDLDEHTRKLFKKIAKKRTQKEAKAVKTGEKKLLPKMNKAEKLVSMVKETLRNL